MYLTFVKWISIILSDCNSKEKIGFEEGNISGYCVCGLSCTNVHGEGNNTRISRTDKNRN